MNAATPTPITSSASRTLTAAMMPSRRFVVPRLPVIRGRSLEGRGLMARAVARRRLRHVGERVVEQLPPFVRDARRALHGGAEAVQLAREVVERRLELAPKRTTLICEEQIPGYGTNHRTADRGKHYARFVHTRLPVPNVAERPVRKGFKLCATDEYATTARPRNERSARRRESERYGRARVVRWSPATACCSTMMATAAAARPRAPTCPRR